MATSASQATLEQHVICGASQGKGIALTTERCSVRIQEGAVLDGDMFTVDNKHSSSVEMD